MRLVGSRDAAPRDEQLVHALRNQAAQRNVVGFAEGQVLQLRA